MSSPPDPGSSPRTRLVAWLRGDSHRPERRLDRWLLPLLADEGALSTPELVASPRLRKGPDSPATQGYELHPEQLRWWLGSALRRGLVAPQVVDVLGNARAPAVWLVSDFGLRRMRQATGPRARVADAAARALRVGNGWCDAVQEVRAESVPEGKPPTARPGVPRITRSPGDEPEAAARARQQLARIDHIVVLMMENRSFDHMLGYLGLIEEPEVNGLQHARPIAWEGRTYEPRRLVGTRFEKAVDPPHGSSAIEEQIAGGAMDGFVRSFARATGAAEPGDIMGYYTWQELPVYDFLAQHFCICDAWHASVPSATWPNRCWSIAGRSVPGREGLFDDGALFALESFVAHLPDQTPAGWRWYSYDPATLRLVDGRYRPGPDAVDGGFWHENFRYVSRHAIDAVPRVGDGDGAGPEEYVLEEGTSMFEDLERGDLAQVTWIDPNFVDLSVLDPTSNDDHPPSDVRAGQELVRRIYTALRRTPAWDRTLFVITYDEHGGFYDHQPPPPSPEPHPEFGTYGVRVPALVVSPLVEPHTVSHTTFDHSSLIRTILERFAPGAVDAMVAGGARRLAHAEHLGRLLTRAEPAPEPAAEAIRAMEEAQERWRVAAAVHRDLAHMPEAAEPRRVRGFPAEFLAASREVRAKGLPAGHP